MSKRRRAKTPLLRMHQEGERCAAWSATSRNFFATAAAS
jgi:hypothetical protein